MIYKNISYLISHVFLMLFMYLFIARRYSRAKTAGICFSACVLLSMSDCLKLNIFSDSRLCYAVVTVFQILVTQLTGLFISKKRDSRVLFMGLSASNYVIAGSLTATIMYIWTGDMLVSMAGSIIVHAVILAVLYFRIRDVGIRYQERESMKGWWELCLIPVFFYCGFSSLVYFPYTLDDNPQNILAAILFILTMFISYVVVMRYLESESQRAGIYWKNVFFESYIKGLEGQYYLVEKSERNLKILRHDMRHYFNLLSSLLEQEEYDEIKKLTDHLKTVTDENKVVKYCDNLITNSILSHMIDRANSQGVTVQMEAVVPKELPFNDYEFASVVANLLENAIRCAEEFEHSEKRVEAKISCEEGHVLIHVQNEYEKEIVFDRKTGLPKSEQSQGHGWGMQGVQAFSNKIGGNLGCYCEDGVFHIMLFAKI